MSRLPGSGQVCVNGFMVEPLGLDAIRARVEHLIKIVSGNVKDPDGWVTVEQVPEEYHDLVKTEVGQNGRIRPDEFIRRLNLYVDRMDYEDGGFFHLLSGNGVLEPKEETHLTKSYPHAAALLTGVRKDLDKIKRIERTIESLERWLRWVPTGLRTLEELAIGEKEIDARVADLKGATPQAIAELLRKASTYADNESLSKLELLKKRAEVLINDASAIEAMWTHSEVRSAIADAVAKIKGALPHIGSQADSLNYQARSANRRPAVASGTNADIQRSLVAVRSHLTQIETVNDQEIVHHEVKNAKKVAMQTELDSVIQDLVELSKGSDYGLLFALDSRDIVPAAYKAGRIAQARKDLDEARRQYAAATGRPSTKPKDSTSDT